MSDFAGTEYDFAAGSLFGMRGWDIDEQGRLHGVTHREVWRPGVNASICKAMKQVPCPGPAEKMPTDYLKPSRISEEVVKPRKKRGRNRRHDEPLAPWERKLLYGTPNTSAPRPRHCGDIARRYGEYHEVPTGHTFDPDCECGFWAYDESGFRPHGKVFGVIEAFGKTTVGTKGFRAEKARIVGLSREGSSGDPLSRSVVSRLTDLYGVEFFDDSDALVTEFPGVLHTWESAGDDFWETPVATENDSLSLTLNGLNSTYRRLMQSSLYRGGVWNS